MNKMNITELYDFIESKEELRTTKEQFNVIDISDLKDDFLYI